MDVFRPRSDAVLASLLTFALSATALSATARTTNALRAPRTFVSAGCVANCGVARAHTLVDVDPAKVRTNGGGGPYYFGSWNAISGYVDLLIVTGSNLNSDANAAGIPTGFYADANACSGTAANAYPFNPNAANPYPALDCSTLAPTDHYRQDGTSNVLTKYFFYGANGASVYEQRMLDPNAAANDPAFFSAVARLVTAERGTGTFSYIFLDDALSPAEHNTYALICNGPQSNAHVHDQTCATAPGGRTTAMPSSFSAQSWERGETALMNALAAQLGLHAIPNGIGSLLGGPSQATAAVAMSSTAWGGFCEACLTSFHSRGQLDGSLAAIAQVERAGKNIAIYDDAYGAAGSSISARLSTLARTMLVFDRDHTYEAYAFDNGSGDEEGCGLSSHTTLCPEALLTYASGTTPAPYSTDRFGNYVRTIPNCQIGGTSAPVGSASTTCTVVVNPTEAATSFVPVPTFSLPVVGSPPVTLSYSTLGIKGDSLCGCYGDTPGALTITRHPFPAATISLAPNAGLIMVTYRLGSTTAKAQHRAALRNRWHPA
jgi:hypothetical protein